MLTQPFTILDQGSPISVTAVLNHETVYLAPAAVSQALGWERKPQGLCRHDRCIPVPEDLGLEGDSGIDLIKLARLLGRPLALNIKERAAYLGVSAQVRAEALATLTAPDFTLPDLNGRLHTLSDYRRRKVLLVAYASW
jgi:hypothetical protein